MTIRRNARNRAFTLVEMMVAMAVMGIVMSFAALEFKDVVFTYLDVDSHLSAEQQARVAIAKVDDLSRQASVVDSTNPDTNPVPAIVQPASTTGPILEFTKAQTLDLNSMPIANGVPAPCYDDISIFVVADSVVPGSDPILQPHNLVERIAPFDPSRTGCTSVNGQGGPPDLRLLARNVASFAVAPIEPCAPNTNNCTPYGQGYRIDIAIFGYDDNKADQHAGALYHLSSVITPLTFGESR